MASGHSVLLIGALASLATGPACDPRQAHQGPCGDHVPWEGILRVQSFEKGNGGAASGQVPHETFRRRDGKSKQEGNGGKAERRPGTPTVRCAATAVSGQWDTDDFHPLCSFMNYLILLPQT